MEIIRKIYYEDEYLGKFKLQKIENKYIWIYVLDWSKPESSADIFCISISKKRYDSLNGDQLIGYRGGESKKVKLVFEVDFEEGDI